MPHGCYFYHPRSDPYMPVEFSVAAYRFGHSMIRPSTTSTTSSWSERDGRRVPIFSHVRPEDDERQNLNGFRRLPHRWGIEWKFFFDLPGADREGQHSYKIDPELGNPLGRLPREVAKDPTRSPCATCCAPSTSASPRARASRARWGSPR